jgi:hypothetical protein
MSFIPTEWYGSVIYRIIFSPLTSGTSFGKCLKSVDVRTYFGITRISVERTCWRVGLYTVRSYIIVKHASRKQALNEREDK